MSIPALPSLDRTSPTFKSDLDTFFLTQLPATTAAFNGEIERISGLGFGSYSSVSESTLAISLGLHTLNVGGNKGFSTGQPVVLASSSNASNAMYGTVVAYSATTGELTVNITDVNGSGSASDWSVSLIAIAPSGVDGYEVGDIKQSASAPDEKWLPCDNAKYLQSAYPLLYAKLGSLPTAQRLPDASGVSQPSIIVTSCIYGAGVFIVTTQGSSNSAQRSADNGLTFSSTTLPSTAIWAGGVYHKGKFILYSTGSSGAVSSDGGLTWTGLSIPSGVSCMISNGETIAVITYTHPNTIQIYTSTDAGSWALRYTNPSGPAYSPTIGAAGNGLLVFGSNLWSTDGITWSVKSVATSGTILGITFALGYFWIGTASTLFKTKNPFSEPASRSIPVAELLDPTMASNNVIFGNADVLVVATMGASSGGGTNQVSHSIDGETFSAPASSVFINNTFSGKSCAVSDSVILCGGSSTASSSSIRRTVHRQYDATTEFVVPLILNTPGALRHYIKAEK